MKFDRTIATKLSIPCRLWIGARLVSRRSGRGSSTEILPHQYGKLELKMAKAFTRFMAKKHGIISSVPDLTLFLSTGGSGKQRILGDRKRQQLAVVFMEQLVNICQTDVELCRAKITFNKIEIAQNFLTIKIYWKTTGDERDEKRRDLLSKSRFRIGKSISEALYNAQIPDITFVADRSELINIEVDNLLQLVHDDIRGLYLKCESACERKPADRSTDS